MRFLGSLNWAQSVALRIEFQSFGVEEEKERMDVDVDDEDAELEGEVGGFRSWFSSAWEEVSEAVVSLESLCGFPGHHGDIALIIGSRVLVMPNILLLGIYMVIEKHTYIPPLERRSQYTIRYYVKYLKSSLLANSTLILAPYDIKISPLFEIHVLSLTSR
jgi:hypothetical protein